MNSDRRSPDADSNKATPSAAKGAGVTASPFAAGGGMAVATAVPFPPGASAPPGVVATPGVASPHGAVAPGAPTRPGTVPPFATPSRLVVETSSAQQRSSSPLSGAGFVRLAKFTIATAVVLATVYVFMKQGLPVVMELVQPKGPASASETQEAAAGVQMLRQTRAVVEKNNHNVAYLDAIMDNADVPAAAKPAEPVTSSAPKPKVPEVKINLKAANRFIDDLPINGVTGGNSPRIIVGGLLVNVDDVVDWRLGLVFAGLDENARTILFRHKDGTLLQRRY